jgi:hypothetical protein
LLDPLNQPFFGCAVAGVNRTGRADARGPRSGAYATAVAERYGAEDPLGFVRGVLPRLRHWNVNTLDAGTGPEFFDQGIYYTEILEIRKAGPWFHSGQALLPDVFDPAWREAVDRRALEICVPRRESRELIGYFTDSGLNWGQRPAVGAVSSRPTLLQQCLSLEPSFAAYHAAWEFVLASRNRDLAALSRDWELDLPNKETLRQLTQAENAIASEGYERDQERFSREFARRYFTTCAAAIRKYDPHHLILGCRFTESPGPAVLAECGYPHVDVLSIAGLPVDEPSAYLDSYYKATNMPLWVGEFSWADEAFHGALSDTDAVGLTAVERMLKNGRTAFAAIAAHPAVVGYAWSRWVDGAEAQPPFGPGLVHIDDREAREHTELLRHLNATAEKLHLGRR